jgi:Tol biopolymer transport system component
MEEVYKVVMIDRGSGERTTLETVRSPAESARFSGTFSDPAFDPTGRTVAWAEGVTGTLYVHDLTTATTEQHRIAEPASLITGVSWSPSGLLAVGVDARLLIVAIGQGDAELTDPLPDGWSVTAAPPAWSADGSRFVVAAQTPETAALLDLVLVDLTQGSIRLLTDERVPPLPLTVFPGFPVWEA